MTEPLTCPHCGRIVMSGSSWHKHLRACDRNPGMYSAILELLTDPGDPGRARPQREYDALAKAGRVTRAETLVQTYRTWTEACAAFDLLPDVHHRRNGNVDRYAAEIDAEIAHARHMVRVARAEWASQGLPVCGVREIDGGKRVAWMVR